MAYKIKVKRKPNQNKANVRFVERQNFKKRKQAEDFNNEFLWGNGKIVEV